MAASVDIGTVPDILKSTSQKLKILPVVCENEKKKNQIKNIINYTLNYAVHAVERTLAYAVIN